MKSVFLCLSVLFLAVNARAESLDELFSRQTTVTVSPVEVQMLPVQASGGGAGTICRSIGFTRLVSYKVKNVDCNQTMVFAVEAPQGSAPTFQSWTCKSGKIAVYEEIVCAR